MVARLYFLVVRVPGKCRDCALLYLPLCLLPLSLEWCECVDLQQLQILMQLLEQLYRLIPEVHMAAVCHMALSHLQLLSWEGIRRRQTWSDVSLKCSCHMQLRGLLSLASLYLIELDECLFHRLVLFFLGPL